MRYIKILLIAVFFFLAMVFFFQNQGPLSQDVTLTFNLFFIPPMTAIPLPFYFIVIGAFALGSLLTILMLAWDRVSAQLKIGREKRNVKKLDKEIKKLKARLEQQTAVDADSPKALPPHTGDSSETTPV